MRAEKVLVGVCTSRILPSFEAALILISGLIELVLGRDGASYSAIDLAIIVVLLLRVALE